MPTNIMVKNFSQFLGLDLSSSDLVRDPKYSSANNNADINDTGALTKRKGYQYITESFGGFGMSVYKNVNTTTGAVTESIISVDNSLYTLTEDYFSVTYSGSGTAAVMSIKVDASTNLFTLIIDVDTVNILTQNLKVGINESSATTVATVISAIDALADFAATGGTITTGSAAFLELQNNVVLSATATRVNYLRWSQANEPTANPLTTTQTYRDGTDFENASFANLNNCLYVSTSYDNLMKYDGANFYRAGAPAGGDADGSGDTGTAPTTAETGSGSTHQAGNEYFYFYTYEQKDNKGNLVEGVPSPYSTKETVAAANTDLNITVTNLLAASGFNTGCAIINGAQTTQTTLTVDSGHTLLVGDTAYFYDSVSAAYVERSITAIAATTITISGAAVTVADNAVISNNLRINLYRTVKTAKTTAASLQTYYLVKSLPNDSLNATQVFLDQVEDESLGAEFVTPIKAHNLPPKGRYLTTFRNQLFIAGIPTDVNSVRYSDIDSPEYFPSGDNELLVDAFEGAKIRGIGALDTAVVVFKDKSIQAVTGDIGQDNFRVDELSYGGIGAVSYHSIQKIKGSLFFLAESGVYSVNLQGVQPVGDRIKPEFTRSGTSFNLTKSVATHWIDNTKYVLFVPNETLDGSSHYYANSNSSVYAYDYSHDAWFKWSNINAQGGFAYSGSTLYFSSRRIDTESLVTEFQAARFNNYGDLNDRSDHDQAVEFSYSTAWMDLGDPVIFKKFLRLKVFALPSDILSGEASLYTLTVQQELNYNTPAPIAEFTMNFGGGSLGYGNGAWGSFPYGDSPIPELKGKLKASKARSLRLIFINETILEDVLISGFELEVSAPYSAHMKE